MKKKKTFLLLSGKLHIQQIHPGGNKRTNREETQQLNQETEKLNARIKRLEGTQYTAPWLVADLCSCSAQRAHLLKAEASIADHAPTGPRVSKSTPVPQLRSRLSAHNAEVHSFKSPYPLIRAYAC